MNVIHSLRARLSPVSRWVRTGSMVALVAILFAPGAVQAQLTAAGSETQANITTNNSQQLPAIAMDENGRFQIAWESHEEDGSGYGIYTRKFTASGSAATSAIMVNTTTTGEQRAPAVD